MHQELETRNLVLLVCDMKQHGDVPPPLCSSQCAIIGVKMYCFGGANEVQSFNSMFVFEIAKEQWSVLDTKGLSRPPGIYGHTMDAWGDKFVVFGGMEQTEEEAVQPSAPIYSPPPCVHQMGKGNSSRNWYHIGQPSDSLFIFDTSDNSWSAPETFGIGPSPRAFHATSIVSSDTIDNTHSLMIHGGCTDKNFAHTFDDCYLLNLNNFSWTTLQCKSLARFGHKISWVPHKEKLFLFGGEQGSEELGTLYEGQISVVPGGAATKIIDWVETETFGTKPGARSFHVMACINQSLYVISGLANSGEFSDDYVYDMNTKRWSKPFHENELCLSAPGAAVMVDKILLYGGSQSSSHRVAALNELEKAKQSRASRSITMLPCEAKLSRHLTFCSILQLRNLMSNAYKFKLVAVGDAGVGKSCLLRRFTQDIYSDHNVPTIGVDFLSVPTMVAGKLVTLQLWDTAGQERYSGVIGNYYRSANGFVIVFDLTVRSSFTHITSWLQQIKEHHDFNAETVKLLIGNKRDLLDYVEVTDEEAQELADRIGAIYLATSAKTGAGVDTAFLIAARHLVDIRKNIELSKTQKINTQVTLTGSQSITLHENRLSGCC